MKSLKALQHSFRRMCNRYGHTCIDAKSGKCPLYNIGLGCQYRYLYDVLTGKRNLDGTLLKGGKTKLNDLNPQGEQQ